MRKKIYLSLSGHSGTVERIIWAVLFEGRVIAVFNCFLYVLMCLHLKIKDILVSGRRMEFICLASLRTGTFSFSYPGALLDCSVEQNLLVVIVEKGCVN